MNFKDQWATDEDGNRFIFTVEMQKRLNAAGLPIEPASLSRKLKMLFLQHPLYMNMLS